MVEERPDREIVEGRQASAIAPHPTLPAARRGQSDATKPADHAAPPSRAAGCSRVQHGSGGKRAGNGQDAGGGAADMLDVSWAVRGRDAVRTWMMSVRAASGCRVPAPTTRPYEAPAHLHLSRACI